MYMYTGPENTLYVDILKIDLNIFNKHTKTIVQATRYELLEERIEYERETGDGGGVYQDPKWVRFRERQDCGRECRARYGDCRYPVSGQEH